MRARLALVIRSSFACVIAAGAGATASARVHRVTPGERVLDGERMNVRPGDVIAVQAGAYRFIRFPNVRGSAERPVTIVNEGGLVDVRNDDRGYAVVIERSQHVHLTGTGSRAHEYGFRCHITKKGMTAFHVNGKSCDVEVDHVEISGAGFAGFNVKDEPRPDGSTNRPNFVMRNINLHHNYVHDVKGEGFYVGHTFYTGYKVEGKVLYPHEIHGLRIHHNLTRRTGCEGIQVGSAAEDVEIHDNVIEDAGVAPFADYQNNGMQIGTATTGRIYNNVIRRCPGTGIIITGRGNNTFANNLVVDCGGSGMYLMDREQEMSGVGYRFVNNTIVNPGDWGFGLNCARAPEIVVANNIVVQDNGKPHIQNHKAGTKLVKRNNLLVRSVAEVGFANPAEGDYRLARASAARGRGGIEVAYGVTTDLAGRDRPKRSAWDLGAYSYAPPERAAVSSTDADAGRAAAASAPRKMAKAGAVAAFDGLLRGCLVEVLAGGDAARVWLAGSKQKLVGIDDEGTLSLSASGLTLTIPWKRLSLKDRLGLALVCVRDEQPDRHAIAAFYALATGDDAAAQRHLAAAGAFAADVRGMFE